MTTLILGLVLFLGAHSISIINDPWRNRMAARLGEKTWKGLCGVVSLVGLVLIIQGFGSARVSPVVLYQPPSWMHPITVLLMLAVFPLLLAAYLPGRIKTMTKHPMLAAVKLWAFAHLLSNGTLPDVVLFGSFLAWAVLDRISLKHRSPRPVPGAAEAVRNDAIVVAVGLVLYLLFMAWLHPVLIGVPVI
jgi:uncharacterized membrane protein